MKLVILLWILPVTLGDIYVTCLYSAECLFPCTSTNLDIIHWYKDSKPVHSFYYNKDQLDHQSEDYKGRTSLLPGSEIKNGNVSLLLKNIRVQDEGRYRCYTANDKTNDEKFVSVSVEAPVQSVDITLKNDTVICNTSGVYPKPQVSWSPEPLANEPLNTFQQTEEKLFMVTSELKVGVITYKYTCSITSKDRTKTATLEEPGSETAYNLSGSTRDGIIAAVIIVAIGISIAIFFVIKRKRKKSLQDLNKMRTSKSLKINKKTIEDMPGETERNDTEASLKRSLTRLDSPSKLNASLQTFKL